MLLDVFNGSAFNVIALTDAINRMPFKPSRIGEMGLFDSRGVTTTSVMVEEKDGVLSLIPTKARGGIPSAHAAEERTVRNFVIPHLPLDATVRADEIQNVRAFGSQDELQGIAQVVNDKIASMRQSHEVTLEYHRLGAIKGLVLDSDGAPVAWPVALAGDKGYRADWIDEYLMQLGIRPVIPSKENEDRDARAGPGQLDARPIQAGL